MITIDDIRNPKRKSGFDHVAFNTYAGDKNGHGGGLPYYAIKEIKRKPSSKFWNGPRRATAKAAAQDYCDYANKHSIAAPAVLKSAGHAYDIDVHDRDPEVEAALGVLRDARAQRRGKQGYVYCITDGEYLKIGYSVNPRKRVAELQTGNARPLSLVAYKPGTEADEAALHAKYIKKNALQEWFHIDGQLLMEFPIKKETA